MGSITDSSIFLPDPNWYVKLYVHFDGIKCPYCLILVHSLVEVTSGNCRCLGQGMYSFLCALGQWCLDEICICGPGNWTFFGTPLFWSYWDLLSGPSSGRICAEYLGAAVGPPWLGIEAPDHQQTVDCWLQILLGWSRVMQTFLVPLLICWYISWRGWGLSCIPVSPHDHVGRNVCVFLPILTTHLLFVYMDFIMLYVFPLTSLFFINLYSRPSFQIESKAFLKSTNHEKILSLF